jgi:hypothetical protein
MRGRVLRELTHRTGGEMSEEQRSDAAQKAQESKEAFERGEEKVRELEKDPPANLEDWPTDEAKYTTFGGGEGDHGYEEGPESKLGPSGLRHHDDGTVTIDGEQVEDPEKYKGEPIPGGPTDPDAPALAGEDRAASDEQRFERDREAAKSE